MNTVQRIAKNSGVLLVSQIASYIFGFFFVMYTARYLGAEGFGVLSFALAFTGIFSVLANFGLDTLATREVSRDKSLAGKYLRNIAVMKIFFGLITFWLLVLTINFLGYQEQTIIVVYIVALSIIFSALNSMFNSIFQAYEKMEFISFGLILNSLLMFSGALIVIKWDFGIIGFAFIYLVSSIIVMSYSLISCSTWFIVPGIEIDFDFWKYKINEAFPFLLAAIFSVIAFKIDMVMLSMMKGDSVVGFYSAGYKIIEILMIFPGIFVTSIYPIISKFHLSSKELLIMIYKKSFKFLSILGLPIASGITILAGDIILLVFGADFNKSIIALQILVWTIPIIFLTFMFGTMLASINRQDLLMKILFVCMFINILMNLATIPRYGYVGACVATVFTELISFILCYYFLTKFIVRIDIIKSFTKPLISSVVMCVFIILMHNVLNLFLLIFVSSILYFSVLIILKTFTYEDMYLLNQMRIRPDKS